MESYSLTEGGCVYHFDTGAFNWYLISQGNRLTLVDAGFPGHYRVFRKALDSLGHELKDIEAIILSHAHADHMGFAERVRQETGAPIFVHQSDLSASQRILQLPWLGLLGNAWRPYVMKILGQAMWNGVFSLPRITKAHAFKDGDVLDVPGKPQVIHVPGHTQGEVAFYLANSQILLSGDTLVTRNLLTGQAGQPQIPAPILSANYQMAAHSLDKLRELGAATILPGHGSAWQGSLADAVDMARKISE